ncbi:MAG: hypothetical protein WC306_02380 [Candidatus Paceibacterota bacterium]|jgi:hypothetical protein
MNKKIIVITGLALIIFILFFGMFVYYREKKNETGFVNTKFENKCDNFLSDNQYVICCIENEKFYNCTDREEFKSGEEIEIIANPVKIENIPENFNYVCLNTDIERKQIDNSFLFFPKECFYYKSEYLWRIGGLIPSIEGVFSLLKINVYPDENMNIRIVTKSQEGITEVNDELIILNLKAKIFKD